MLVVASHVYYPRVFLPPIYDDFDIVFADQRQWVPTPEGFDVGTITTDTMSDDIEAIRAATGLERPIVLGHSQHASWALEYARRYPDQTRGVAALAAVPPLGSEAGLESADDFFRRDATPQRIAAHEHNRATGAPAKVETSQEFIAEYLSLDAMNWYDHTFHGAELWKGVEVNLPVLYQQWAPTGLGGFKVEGIDVPVFLGLGRYDYRIPHYLWDGHRQQLPHLTYKLYDKSGHTPQFEQPEEFAADLRAWAEAL